MQCVTFGTWPIKYKYRYEQSLIPEYLKLFCKGGRRKYMANIKTSCYMTLSKCMMEARKTNSVSRAQTKI